MTTAANPWLERRPLLYAHQGGSLEAPSNTLFAFATAIAAGADALELDVHATADGHLVVVHDPTVEGTTDGRGAVADLTLGAVQRLDAAWWFVPDAGTAPGRPDAAYVWRGVAAGRRAAPEGFAAADFRIPTLDEVLTAFPTTYVNIDIEATAPTTMPYEAELARVLADHGRTDDTIVASFHDDALVAFARTRSPVSTSATPAEVAAFWAAVNEGAAAPDLRHRHALQVPMTFAGLDVVTPDFVAAAHASALAVHVWTIDDATTAAALLAMGVDGIVSDRPRALRSALPRAQDGTSLSS